jgi:hypothetical protein
MNEKLALENWWYYDECNWLLKKFLSMRYDLEIDDIVQIYYDKRNAGEGNEYIRYALSRPEFDDIYENYLDKKYMYEDYLEFGEESGMCYVPFNPSKRLEALASMKNFDATGMLLRKIRKSMKMKAKLREIDEVILYKSDFDFIKSAKIKHGLTVHQTEVLFGLIFFSRLNDSQYCRIGSKFKRKQFCSCFNRTIEEKDWLAVSKVMEQHIQIKPKHENEVDFVYPNFENKDAEAYKFVTTVENNRLDLSELAREVLTDIADRYCSCCGKAFTPNSNRQRQCDECREKYKTEQARLRKQKSRANKALK